MPLSAIFSSPVKPFACNRDTSSTTAKETGHTLFGHPVHLTRIIAAFDQCNNESLTLHDFLENKAIITSEIKSNTRPSSKCSHLFLEYEAYRSSSFNTEVNIIRELGFCRNWYMETG